MVRVRRLKAQDRLSRMREFSQHAFILNAVCFSPMGKAFILRIAASFKSVTYPTNNDNISQVPTNSDTEHSYRQMKATLVANKFELPTFCSKWNGVRNFHIVLYEN